MAKAKNRNTAAWLAREEREALLREKRNERFRSKSRDKQADKQAGTAGKISLWYLRECRRLGVTREEIDAAVKRGWCGHEIESLAAADAGLLAGPPPPPAETMANRHLVAG